MKVPNMERSRKWSWLLPLVRLFCYACLIGTVSGIDRMPEQFHDICRVEETILEAGGQRTSRITCFPGQNDHQVWRLDILRNWALSIDNELDKFSYELMCGVGGNISLPLPIKCPGLVSLSVRNCNVTDSFEDFGNPVINSIPSSLRRLQISDSFMVQKRSKVFEMFASVDKLTSDYECLHPDTLEEMIFRNVTYVVDDDLETLMQECLGDSLGMAQLGDMLNKNGSDTDPSGFNVTMETPKGESDTTYPKTVSSTNDVTPPSMNGVNSRRRRSNGKCAFLDLNNLINVPKSLDNLDIRCNYEKLRVLEDSSNSIMSVVETKFLEKYNQYPVVEVFNYSNNNIDVLPPELTDWSFLFDNLKHLDLSHNRIRKFSFKSTYSSNNGETYVDLQYNNITTLTSSDLVNLRKEKKLYIDIRNNPIDCNCYLKDFIESLSKENYLSSSRYGYLKELKCASPARLTGKQLKTLTIEDLDCTTEVMHSATVFVVLGVFLIVLFITAVILCLYRKEVKVLVRSRHNNDMKASEQSKNKRIDDGKNFHTVVEITKNKDGAM